MSGNVHEPRLTAINHLAHGVVEYRFASGPVKFRPGQFMSVRVGNDEDGDPVLRSYSIASTPDETELGLILKLVPGGIGSDCFARLAIGETLRMTGPMGFFVNELAHPGDVVFGATGVGITPVLAMVAEQLARPETGRLHLLWGNRDPEDLFWLDQFRALAARHPRFSLSLHISRGALAEGATRGRITAPLLELAPTLSKPTFYLVGNGHMIREIKGALLERRLVTDRRRQIRTEQFFD